MANRLFSQFFHTLEKGPVKLWAQISFGSTGAPTLVTNEHKGVKAISRTGTGAYTITLGSEDAVDKYTAILCLTGVFGDSTAANVIALQYVDDSLSTDGTIDFLTLDAGGAAADPDSGVGVLLEITLRNSAAV